MLCRNRCIGLRRGRDQSTSDCISCDDVTVVFCDVCPGFSLLFYIQLWCVSTFRCRKVGVFSCLDFLNLALSLGLWVTAPITVVLGAFCLILWISECFIQKMTDFPAGHPGWGAAPITSSQSEEVHRTHCSAQVVECQSLRPSQHHFAGLSEPGPWRARWSWVKLKPQDFPVMPGRMPGFLEKHLQQTNPKPTTGWLSPNLLVIVPF